jgi:DnaK suppressor protein
MDTENYKAILQNRERELEGEISRQLSDGKESKTAEVEDPIDHVTSSEGRAAAFEESSRLSDMLQMVREALHRVEDGSFGKCIDCGRQIEEARLQAVPWTPYCKADQEKHDAASTQEADLGAVS